MEDMQSQTRAAGHRQVTQSHPMGRGLAARQELQLHSFPGLAGAGQKASLSPDIRPPLPLCISSLKAPRTPEISAPPSRPSSIQ